MQEDDGAFGSEMCVGFVPSRFRDSVPFMLVEELNRMWFALAIAAAVCFGIRGIFYHWSSQQGMNRNLMLSGVFAAGLFVCLALNATLSQPWNDRVLYGLLMGLFSFAANAAMYKGFATGKASSVALLIALPAVPVVLLAYLLWGETLTAGQWAAFLIIVTGVALVRFTGDFSWQQREGMKWGLAAMLFFALSDVTNKQAAVAGAAPFPMLALMFACGTALFGGWWLREKFLRQRAFSGGTETAPQERAEADGALIRAPWSEWKTFLWGVLAGLFNAAGMIFLFWAFESGITGLVSAIISLNVVILLLYARFVVKEPFKPQETAGLAISLAGVLVLHLVS